MFWQTRRRRHQRPSVDPYSAPRAQTPRVPSGSQESFRLSDGPSGSPKARQARILPFGEGKIYAVPPPRYAGHDPSPPHWSSPPSATATAIHPSLRCVISTAGMNPKSSEPRRLVNRLSRLTRLCCGTTYQRRHPAAAAGRGGKQPASAVFVFLNPRPHCRGRAGTTVTKTSASWSAYNPSCLIC